MVEMQRSDVTVVSAESTFTTGLGDKNLFRSPPPSTDTF